MGQPMPRTKLVEDADDSVDWQREEVLWMGTLMVELPKLDDEVYIPQQARDDRPP